MALGLNINIMRDVMDDQKQSHAYYGLAHSFTTNICTKIKCISFSQISWPEVWETLLAIWTDFVRPIQQCLFSPMDKILGTLDHMEDPQQ